MWTIGHDDTDGNRTEVAWFLYKFDAQKALQGLSWRYTVEWAPGAQIVAS